LFVRRFLQLGLDLAELLHLLLQEGDLPVLASAISGSARSAVSSADKYRAMLSSICSPAAFDLGRGEVPVTVINRLELAAIDDNHGFGEQIQLAAQQNELTLESVEAMIHFKPESVVNRIAPRAALWIYPEEDTVVPVEESQSMYARAHEPRKLVALKGFKHYELYQGAGFKQVMNHSTEWFEYYLRKEK